MFNTKQYRDKAAEYSDRGKAANGPNESRELEQLEKSFTTLADNEQWLSDNHRKTVRTAADAPVGSALAEEEEHLLRCLGAAVLMQWNTIPQELQRELFDNAGAMEELLHTAELRSRIARFLHKHNDEATGGSEA